MFGAFAVFLVLMSLVGQREYNQDQRDHGEASVSYAGYVTSGNFVEAVFENWESEFLQMGMFVVLTVFLRQKGSVESKKLDGEEPVDEDPRHADLDDDDVPWPVRTGGVKLWLYERSLSIALLGLFAASFLLHAAGGAREYSAEQEVHGGSPVGMLRYITTARFWFESFQNWQSEFLSVAVLVLLSIRLREQGSAQSKPVAAPHSNTGE